MKKEISLDSISGYFEYTGREEAKDVEKEVEDNESGYFGYTGSHSVGTSSSMGMLNTREDRKKFKKEIKKYFYKKGNICWDLVISLESDEEAAKLGLETVDNWNSIMSDALPKIFKQYDLEYNNVLWWFDVHRNTEHPHVHLAFIEKHQTRFKGKISKAKLENVKRSIYTCIAARQKLAEKTGYDYREYFKLKDKEFNQLVTLVKGKDLSNVKTLNQLFGALPKTGRLQYNSYNMKEFKPAIDRIIDEIIFNSKFHCVLGPILRKIRIIRRCGSISLTAQQYRCAKYARQQSVHSFVLHKILLSFPFPITFFCVCKIKNDCF